MKTSVFLMLSAAALLGASARPGPARPGPARSGPARPGPARPGPGTKENLNLIEIVNLAQSYKALHRDVFVEDVSALVEAGCNNTFFCKVHDILQKHENFTRKRSDEEKIVKNLKLHLDWTKDDCSSLLHNETASIGSTEVPKLMEFLVICIQRFNFGP
ncbi:hypothetical protein EYF80_049520 [Liparis tanakae]|uniref:Uncharacterized protein n=1 Tax=Liparis tanakae TaxID=230148 RepID=A0A4Z2FHB1_9TELE|nr:hypothetical protein EYF80_049520 [Liparis tanakae]